jgi:hypothetical protein
MPQQNARGLRERDQITTRLLNATNPLRCISHIFGLWEDELRAFVLHQHPRPDQERADQLNHRFVHASPPPRDSHARTAGEVDTQLLDRRLCRTVRNGRLCGVTRE